MSVDEATPDIVAEMRALVLLCVNGAEVPPSATIRATLNRWADEIERLQTEVDMMRKLIVHCETTERT